MPREACLSRDEGVGPPSASISCPFIPWSAPLRCSRLLTYLYSARVDYQVEAPRKFKVSQPETATFSPSAHRSGVKKIFHSPNEFDCPPTVKSRVGSRSKKNSFRLLWDRDAEGMASGSRPPEAGCILAPDSALAAKQRLSKRQNWASHPEMPLKNRRISLCVCVFGIGEARLACVSRDTGASATSRGTPAVF